MAQIRRILPMLDPCGCGRISTPGATAPELAEIAQSSPKSLQLAGFARNWQRLPENLSSSPEFRRNRPRIGRPEIGRDCTRNCRVRPSDRPRIGRCRQNIVEIAPELVGFVRNWPSSPEKRSVLPEYLSSWPQIGRSTRISRVESKFNRWTKECTANNLGPEIDFER